MVYSGRKRWGNMETDKNKKYTLSKSESSSRIVAVVRLMVARCDEIASCGQDSGHKICNFFDSHESRKTVRLWQEFIEVIAMSSKSAIAAARPELQVLAAHIRSANDAIVNSLPPTSRNLITCISAGEQFILNLLLRGDSTALRLAKLARPLSVPLRQLILLCSQKLHEQLTVGC